MDSRRLVRAPYRLASTLLLFASLFACEGKQAPGAAATESQAPERAEGVRAVAVTESSAALSAPGVLPASQAEPPGIQAEPTAASAAVAEDDTAGQAGTGQAGTGQAGTGQAGTGQAGTGQAGVGASTSEQGQPAPPVAVSKQGSKFDPPVKMEQIPDGAWVCDMGTVHYARLEKGDGVCPLCKMDLVQKGAPKPAPAKPAPQSPGEHAH